MKFRAALTVAAVIGFSVPAAFAACPSQPPILVAPSDGATGISSPVDFRWREVSGASSYRVWASIDGGTPNVIALTSNNDYDVSLPGGSVEWWVDALGDGCTTLTSNHFRFTAAGGSTCPSNAMPPVLTAPADGASGIASPVTLTWNAVNGADEYRIHAQLNGLPSVVIGSTAATQVTLPFPQASITWFVEALFDGCPSTVSRSSSFTVASGSSCTNTSPTAIAPANGVTTSSPVTFRWSAVPGAAGYKLYVGSSEATADLAGITTDTTLTRILGDGSFVWWVAAVFPGCPDTSSAKVQFTIREASCGGSISLLAPAENANVNAPVLLSWTPVSGADAYRIWIAANGGTPFVIARSTNASQLLPLPGGAIEWWVEALLDQCPSVLSPHGHFNVARSATCGTNQPAVPIAPINGAQSGSPVQFQWSAAPGALLYRVWVSVNDDPFQDLGATADTQLTREVDPGNVQWYVEAIFPGCDPVDSAKTNFTIPQSPRCQNGKTILISPPDGATGVTAPVTMVWSAVPGATEYRVFSRIDGGKILLLDRTRGTSSTRPVIPGNFEWWVESDFDSCPGTKSVHEHFTVPQSADCGNDVPQLVAPADGITDVSSPVTFAWNPVSDAVGYALIVQHDGGSPTPIAATLGTTLTRRVPEGTIAWWIVAFFPGCTPRESAHATFTTAASECQTRAPILLAPASGATHLNSPVRLSWSPVPGATGYKVWAGIGDQDPSTVTTTTDNKLTIPAPGDTITWYVEAQFASCPPAVSASATFSVDSAAPPCDTPERPVPSVAAQVAGGTPYTIQWNAVPNAANYELLEAAHANFSDATMQVVDGVSATISHPAAAEPVRYFYRLRAVSACSDAHGPYSKIVSVLVLSAAATSDHQTSIDVGSGTGAAQQIALPPQNLPVPFTAHADKPWITVSPASGIVGPQGATLTVTYDPATLQLGTNTGTVIVSYGSGGRLVVNGAQPSIPVSVSLVTPVSPVGKNTPPPDSLIIPAVGHAPGANGSLFESDVRLANVSAQTMTYQLNFTLTSTDGTKSGQSTTIDVDPGATMALDDILANFFGIGGDGGAATGVLEIRPLTSTTSSGANSGTPSVQTVASSRTFDSTPDGTFGQFIPAIPFSQFVASPGRISLQQIAQSSAFRTNLGLVEAAGESATVLVHVLDDSGNELAAVPESLQPGEHLQINNFLAANGIPSLADGRIEVEVTSPTGKVSAYASVVDNVTNDPLVVFPVTRGTVSAERFVVPGVADIDNPGASWRTDLRLFNSGAEPVSATLTYSPQPGSIGAAGSTMAIIQPGEVKAIDDALQSLYGIGNTGGALLVTTPSNSGLVVTARTFDQTSNGTFGQFIPAVTPADSIGIGERSLQLLQLESSDRYRTNIGLAETSGSPATARISLILPDSKFAINVDVPLAANGFVQLPLAGFNAGTVYNGRVSVSVVGGTGRITAYGSVVDETTQDPTYVPAQ